MDIQVSPASADDALEVRRILDAAMLEPGDVEARIEDGNVLVAARENGSPNETERPLGAVVLKPHADERGSHVSAIGVRRRTRGQGIGRLLMERALEREKRLTARFDDGVRPFYERLGFSIEAIDDSRYRGVLTATDRIDR